MIGTIRAPERAPAPGAARATALPPPRPTPRALGRGAFLLVLATAVVAGCGAGGRETAGPPADSGYVVADDGVRLFYRTVGEGSQAVLVPVGFYLEASLDRLAGPDRRLVFYDPRARGRSESGDRSRITLDRQVADMEAVRRGLGLDSMAIIGWSGLGMETAVYALRHPARVTRLVQVAPVPPREEPHGSAAYRERSSRMDPEAVAGVRERVESGEFDGAPAAYCRALRQVTAAATMVDPGRLAEVPDPCRFPNEYPDSLALVFGPLLDSFRGYDWRDEIAALPVPRLVIHGVEDAFPVEGSREWVPPGSSARLLLLDGAGHFPFLERPDVFFPAVEAFLEGGWPSDAEAAPAGSE